jgi:uncharacterized membrane protein YoaK (UPF0700 family)
MRREQKELQSRKILRGRYMWVGLVLGAVVGLILSQAIYSRG